MNAVEQIRRCAERQSPTPTPPPQGWQAEPPRESPLWLAVGGALVMLTWGLVALALYLIGWAW